MSFFAVYGLIYILNNQIMKDQPSYTYSTLSLAFLWSLGSVFLLIIIAIFVAVRFPAAYELSSNEKMLVLVLVLAYLGFVWLIVWAYLGTRMPNAPQQPGTLTVTDTTNSNSSVANAAVEAMLWQKSTPEEDLHSKNDIQDVW